MLLSRFNADRLQEIENHARNCSYGSSKNVLSIHLQRCAQCSSPVRFPLALLVDARVRSVRAPARVPVHLSGQCRAAMEEKRFGS